MLKVFHPLVTEPPTSRFPNGEAKISILDIEHFSYQDNVDFKWTCDSDLMELFLLKKHNPKLKNLRILYMPYGRMDRDASGSSNCSLKYIGEFIRDMGWESIKVLDPHSELTAAYLGNNVEIISPGKYIHKATWAFSGLGNMFTDKACLMFPDLGAQKRYKNELFFERMDRVVGVKDRNFADGKISSLILIGGERVKDKDVLIVDDLCSYGRTFIAAAEELKKYSPKKIFLWVTHCENSILKGDIFKDGSPIDAVFTTDSLFTETENLPNNLHILNIFGEKFDETSS